MDPKESRAGNGGTFPPGNQVSRLAVRHGTLAELVPAMTLKAAPGNDAIPDVRIDLMDTLEHLHV
jgi:hypothetical protein